MLIKCPGCYTTYRVSDNLIGSSKPTFRCSRCKLIFALDLKSKVADETTSGAIQTTLGRKGDEPSLPFPSSTEATGKENAAEEFLSREKTESPHTHHQDSQPSETPYPVSEDQFAQRQETLGQGQDPLGDSQDSIAEIQRFLTESQQPPTPDPQSLNRSLDFPTHTQDSLSQSQEPDTESQEPATQSEETPTEKEGPLAAHEFLAQSQEAPGQSQDIVTQGQEPDTQSQDFVTQSEEASPQESETPNTMSEDPIGLERESPSSDDNPALEKYGAEIPPELITQKPKLREYKGKTFAKKKQDSALTPGAGGTDQTLEPYVERRRTPIAAHETRTGGPVSIIPYISLFGILLLTFSLLTLIYQAQPARMEAYLRSIPWFGSVILKNNHLRQRVVLESLRSGFRKVLGGRQVFVITGKISNRNPVSVREIRLEGLIHTAGGNEIGRQAISVGNPISSKIIRDMTVREIAILQRLKPQKRFEIAPDGSAAFTIVFLKPPKDIKAFSCRVLSTKGEA